ncbi:alkaline phosphatase family protein [Thermosipho atlanticus]|uniref:alkaline phosphatase family protein n=1 Tax=Thermosipho atlanticus TaxID=238991 RepID=UPI003899F1BB
MKPDYKNSIVAFVNVLLSKFKSEVIHEEFNDMKDLLAPELEGADKIIVLIIDSLGYNKFLTLNEKLKFEKYYKLSSVFPTTTVSAITSYMTGLTPQEHGLLGYIQFLRELGTILNMIDFSYPGMSSTSFDTLIKRKIKRLPNVFQKIKKEGYYAGILTGSNIANSGLSFLIQKDANVLTYYTLGDMFATISKLFQKEFKGLVYVYYGMLDGLGHKKGPDSYSYETEAEYILRELKRIIELQKGKNTRVFITADHGMVQIPRNKNVFLGDELRKFLRIPPTGEMRMMYLYTKVGKKQQLVDYFNDNFKNRFELISSKEALAEGYFGIGKLHPETLNRIGDLVLVTKENYAFTYLYTGGEDKLEGMHGALTEEELYVPLIVL